MAAPLLRVPIAGAVSYLHQPRDFHGASYVGAAIMIAAAAAAIIAVLIKSRLLLALAGTVPLGELCATLLDVHLEIKMAEAQAAATPIADPFVMWQSAVCRQMHYAWGIAVIAAGGLMLLAAAALRD